MPNNRVDLRLSLCENLGMADHGEDKVGDSRTGLERKQTFSLSTETGRQGAEELERTVSMLPVYIELVVHLRSKSSSSVIFSFLSNASEVKDGVAVPFFCIIRGRCQHVSRGRNIRPADNFLHAVLVGFIDEKLDQFLPLDGGLLESGAREPRREVPHCEAPIMRRGAYVFRKTTHETGICQPPKHLRR